REAGRLVEDRADPGRGTGATAGAGRAAGPAHADAEHPPEPPRPARRTGCATTAKARGGREGLDPIAATPGRVTAGSPDVRSGAPGPGCFPGPPFRATPPPRSAERS